MSPTARPLEKLAIIGARGHLRDVIDGLKKQPHIRVVGIAPAAADEGSLLASTFADAASYADWLKMLDEQQPQAVVICGPFEQHAEMASAALTRDIHVYIEKPAALTLKQLHTLRAANVEHPGVLLTSMMRLRYLPGFRTARQLIRQGRIGQPKLVNARKSYKLGKRPDFQLKRETYGGTIPWIGSHAIDWMLWMTGLAVESIYAIHTRGEDEELGNLEQSAQCLFGLSSSCSATISIDLYRPATAPTHGDDWIRIVGSEGVIEARGESLTLISSSSAGVEKITGACARDLFSDFVAAVEGRQAAPIDAQQTLALTEVCLRARESADRGGVVDRLSPSEAIGYAKGLIDE